MAILQVRSTLPCVLILFIGFVVVKSQNITETGSDTPEPSTTSKTPVDSCELHNNDCKACVSASKCYYCDSDNQCKVHIQNIIADGRCKISNAYFLTCKVNFKYFMIIIGSLSGLFLLSILICCCCCCCRRKGIRISKDDLKWARRKEERKLASAEKRKERAERTDEIRRKYGLVRESNPYQKFDA